MSIPLLLYYGMEYPEIEKTRELRGSLVVIQDYHPIVYENLISDFFPHSFVYLYFNISYIHQDEVYDGINKDQLEYNPDWNTYKLNFSDPETIKFLKIKMNSLLSFKNIAGFFIDDLDLLETEMRNGKHSQDFVSSFLKSIFDQNFQLKIIANRGLHLLSMLPFLEAVILENWDENYPMIADSSELEWLKLGLAVKLKILQIKNSKRAIRVFGVKYRELELSTQESSPSDFLEERKKLKEILSQQIEYTFVSNRELSLWPM